ncbi:MAG: M1 family peptidase, partial [Desulfobacterales bacterium]|nr:M1 family peptidase [Desulfobacterales bacterium]
GYLSLYEELFGPYPFPKFAVVENFFPTGYGFPSYTLIGDRVLRLPFILTTSLGHEIAHCWWGNGVFVDSAAGNWSEGLTTYVADYLYRERTSEEEAREARLQMIRNYATLVPETRDFPLARFTSRTDPVTKAVGYDKGAMVFHMLRREVGEDHFWGALKEIYWEHLFRTAAWGDIQRAFERRAGRPLEWFFEQWVRRPGAPRLRLEEADVQAAGGGFAIAGRLSQDKPLFRGVWEVVAETGRGRVTRAVGLVEGAAAIALSTASKPTALQVDPEAHMLRRLDPSEIPPAVNALKSSPSVLLVISGDSTPEAVRSADILIRSLGLRQAAVMTEAELGAALPADRDLILIGLPRERGRLPEPISELDLGPAAFSVGGEHFNREGDSLFAVLRHPRSPQHVIALWHHLGRGGSEAALAKITHYGRYGLLVFRDGVNRVKATWPVAQSPVSLRWNSIEN